MSITLPQLNNGEEVERKVATLLDKALEMLVSSSSDPRLECNLAVDTRNTASENNEKSRREHGIDSDLATGNHEVMQLPHDIAMASCMLSSQRINLNLTQVRNCRR